MPAAFVLAALVGAYLVAVAIDEHEEGLIALAGLLLAAGLLAAAWRADRRSVAAAMAEADRAREEAQRAGAQAQHQREEAEGGREEADRERVRLRAELGRRDEALTRQRDLLDRVDRSRRAEREWSRELRGQLARRYEEQGVLAYGDDVRALVLRAAIGLTDAEKGLLLSRGDEDGDGDLDLMIAHGFDHEPEGSEVAQRFAREVLAHDQIIREDDPHAGGDRTQADDEIDTLVAIPVYLRDRFHGVVVCANRDGGFEELDDELLLALGDHAGSALQSAHLRAQLEDAHRSALRMLAEVIAARDPGRHQEAGELTEPATGLAAGLGLDERERDVLLTAALVRDVGLVSLPDDILHTPEPLGADGLAAVELHPRIAFNVLQQIPALRDVAEVVLHHHERFDGRGYPAGLAGDAIPRLSRALAVLDAFSALTHERPHRRARSAAEAGEELVEAAGTQFDPEITQLFVEHLRRSPHVPGGVVPIGSPDGTSLIGRLAAPTADALTLLGNHRAFLEAIAVASSQGGSFTVAILQLDDLARVNEQAGYAAGDRTIQLAARHLQRVASRLGAGAYRESGRRLALLAPVPEDAVAASVELEFAAGPAVRLGVASWHPGERGDELVARARRALRAQVGAPGAQGQPLED